MADEELCVGFLSSFFTKASGGERIDRKIDTIARLFTSENNTTLSSRIKNNVRCNNVEPDYNLDLFSKNPITTDHVINDYSSSIAHEVSEHGHSGSASPASLASTATPITGSGDQTIVIHVCDEAKGIKKDFFCQKTLLITEMQYFVDYLASDGNDNSYDDVDISVHCDVKIFDWLIKYTKRSIEPGNKPMLDINNVISIIISSEFLKMDNLVKECIDFCRANLTMILETSSNLGSLSQSILSKLAESFHVLELDDITDKKDKVKSQLFMFKIQQLFEIAATNQETLFDGASCFLVKCRHCEKVMPFNGSEKLQCIPENISISKHGSLGFGHSYEQDFDIDAFIINLRKTLKSYRKVYWYLWSISHTIFCQRCTTHYRPFDITECRIHTESQEDDRETKEKIKPTFYECCGAPKTMFSPVPQNGCSIVEHVIPEDNIEKRIYQLAHRVKDVLEVCRERLFPEKETEKSETDGFKCDIFATERERLLETRFQETWERVRVLNGTQVGETENKDDGDSTAATGKVKKSSKTKKDSKGKSQNSENKLQNYGRQLGDGMLLEIPEICNPKMLWDNTKQLRSNQDIQREEEQRRFDEISNFLVRYRTPTPTKTRGQPAVVSHVSNQLSKTTAKNVVNSLSNYLTSQSQASNPVGGIYARIEAKWRLQNHVAGTIIPLSSSTAAAISGLTGSGTTKANSTKLLPGRPTVLG